MCGINGIKNFNGQPVDRKQLEDMNQLLIHRGPDDKGYYVDKSDKSLGLAMQRLSIIDLSGGQQPISNEDKSVWIVFNGEIYNYIELRQDLIKKGHHFKTNSDTEVIVHLYEEKGTELLDDLNGIFTFAVWDKNKKQLFIARDRLGVKPLFYFKTADCFAFSSELKSLLKIAPFTKKINENAFLLYLLLMYVPDPLSIVEGISKLEAGYYLLVDQNGNVAQNKYWDVEPKKKFIHFNEKEAKDYLLFLLKDALKIQLRSDVPLGIFLSGGLDSSSLVAIASEIQTKPIITLSVGYENHLVDERLFAQQIAKQYQTNHFELFIRPKDLKENFNELIWLMDEPFSDSAAIANFLLAKLARKNGIKVILSGAGGDEIFGGYERYLFDWKHVFKNLARFFSVFGRLRNNNEQLDYICSIGCGRGLGIFLSRNKFNELNFYKNFQKVMKPFSQQINLWSTPLQKKSFLDLKNYLIGDILMLFDKMTMGASVEGRVPLLDHRLVEFMFSLPDHFKIKNKEKKYLLKQTMRDKLPEEILNRPKMGFGAPVSHWLKDILAEKSGELNFTLNGRSIQYDFLLKRNSFRQILFGLEIFKQWHENVFKKFL